MNFAENVYGQNLGQLALGVCCCGVYEVLRKGHFCHAWNAVAVTVMSRSLLMFNSALILFDLSLQSFISIVKDRSVAKDDQPGARKRKKKNATAAAEEPVDDSVWQYPLVSLPALFSFIPRSRVLDELYSLKGIFSPPSSWKFFVIKTVFVPFQIY